MTWISKSITTFGLILLAHACYSAREHSALQQSTASSASAATAAGSGGPTAAAALPVDISIETVTALVVVCLGLVLGTPELRPIRWREWAGKIEREGAAGSRGAASEGGGDSGSAERDFVGNPFRYLESRPAFVDIRKQRREFAEWVKHGTDGKKP